MSTDVWTAVFGWCAVINITILTVATIAMVSVHSWIARIHAKLFGLSDTDIKLEYFRFLSNYKLLTTIFFVVPYFALKIAT